MSYTIIIIAITAIISIAAFNRHDIYDKLILWPRKMQGNPVEYYRLITSGFVHADWMHLLFNMFTLYCFGPITQEIFGVVGIPELFLVLYLSGIVVSSLPSFLKNRNNPYYRSLGASGGVAALIFATIYYNPWSQILIYFFPMPMIIFAVIYVGYSIYMSKRGGDNVNHDAHLWGSLYGLVFAFLLDPTHGAYFIDQLSRPHF